MSEDGEEWRNGKNKLQPTTRRPFIVPAQPPKTARLGERQIILFTLRHTHDHIPLESVRAQRDAERGPGLRVIVFRRQVVVVERALRPVVHGLVPGAGLAVIIVGCR